MSHCRSLSRSLLVRPLALVLVVSLTMPWARATWSIVVANTRTGELAIGCATCLVNIDLEMEVPVMIPGLGAACAQSQLDSGAVNRRIIWDELLAGTRPRDILQVLRDSDGNHQNRQYGIVDLQGRRASFTGSLAGEWKGGVRGIFDGIAYAIQGNVLAGEPVILEAERLLRETPGDLADKLMAAMLVAAEFGGDGRCSCSGGDPDGCGSPVPGFDPQTGKSAHVAFMVLSRIGGRRGRCNRNLGCANGDYYLNLNITPGTGGPPDPTIELLGLFGDWRESLRGVPDHLLTTRVFNRDGVAGNGTDRVRLDLRAVDWSGEPVRSGGAVVTVQHAANSAGLAQIEDVEDRGGGHYRIWFTAGLGQGTDVFRVRIEDGLNDVLLYPFPTLEHQAPLAADVTSLSAISGGSVSFDLRGPASEAAPHQYLVLASLSGTSPGTPIGPLLVPLNFDAVFGLSILMRNSLFFPDTFGTLDDEGRAEAGFFAPPGLLGDAVGSDLSFAFLTTDDLGFVSGPVSIAINP